MLHRVNVGGLNSVMFMQKLLQLRHPSLAAAVSFVRAKVIDFIIPDQFFVQSK